MSEDPKRASKPLQSAPALSLDSWAVIVALALAFAIWLGWIKQVPW
jgi:hypothetical protein